MNKIEYAWVIQRDDGKVFAGENSKRKGDCATI